MRSTGFFQECEGAVRTEKIKIKSFEDHNQRYLYRDIGESVVRSSITVHEEYRFAKLVTPQNEADITHQKHHEVNLEIALD